MIPPGQVVAIVPAKNAENTISAVVKAIVRSRVAVRVIVVDMGSTDSTCRFASASDAHIVRASAGADRCGAIAQAVGGLQPEVRAIGIIDGSLVGLRPDHVHMMFDPVTDDNRIGMVCGLHDYGPVVNKMQPHMPIITKDRVILRRLLESVPHEFWTGHRLEVGMNEVVARSGLATKLEILLGVKLVPMWKQEGLKSAIEDMARMTIDVLEATRDSRK